MTSPICRACLNKNLVSKSFSAEPIAPESLEPGNMRVTDKAYGSCIETLSCPQCGLVQPTVQLKPQNIVALYEAMDDSLYLESAGIRGRSNARQVMTVLKKLNKSAKNVLEIGAGSGALLKALSKNIPETCGVEPSAEFRKWAKENLNQDILAGGYESLAVEPKWELIVALDVIEHVTDPDHFMKTVSQLLAPGGIAIICTPNKASLTAKILGKKWWHIRPPHLFYFTPLAFKTLSERHHLKTIYRSGFSWTLSLGYLIDSVLKLLFKKSFSFLLKIDIPIRVNTLDSMLFVLEKPRD